MNTQEAHARTLVIKQFVSDCLYFAPINAATVNRLADTIGFGKNTVRKHIFHYGRARQDCFSELAEANGLPATLGFFWVRGTDDRMSDDAALSAMRDLMKGIEHHHLDPDDYIALEREIWSELGPLRAACDALSADSSWTPDHSRRWRSLKDEIARVEAKWEERLRER